MGMNEALKTYRTSNSLSLEAVAKVAGTTRQSMWRIERGLQSPSLDMIARIVRATNGAVTANDFLPPTVPADLSGN